MKNRLPYIDQLKGFAILTVVIGHFVMFCLNDEPSVIIKLIYSFHMPLFAFLSGLMFRSFNDIKSIEKKFLRQSYKLLLPFVSFGIIYMYTIRSGQDFITHSMKLGVWYLLFLWQCYLLTHGYHWLTEKIGRSSSVRLLVDACWILLTMVAFRSLWMELSPVLKDTFGIGHLFELYPFFFIGYVIKRTATFERWFGANELLFDVSIILWSLFFFLSIIGYQFKGLLGLMMGISAVYFIVALFYRSHVRGGGNSRISRTLEIFGKDSLGIYVLHRFLTDTFDVGMIGKYIGETGSVAIEFLISVPLSIAFCWLCIGMIKVIRLSRILSLLFLGEKSNKVQVTK